MQILINDKKQMFARKQFLTSTFFTSAQIIQQIKFKSTLPVYIYNMNEAYLRFGKGQETFDFTFRYVDNELKIDRQFNFSRRAAEPVSAFLKRVDVNVGKVVYKKKTQKLKKLKKAQVKLGKDQDDKEESDEDISIPVALLRNETTIKDDVPCETAFENISQLTLQISKSKYAIKQNVPWIETINLPQCILVGSPTYPSKFVASFTNIKDSKFVWYKNLLSSTPNKPPVWKEIGNEYIYVPATEDMGCTLKISCIPGNEEQTGPYIEVVSPNLVEAGPGRCPFEDRHEFTRNKLSGNRYFRILNA